MEEKQVTIGKKTITVPVIQQFGMAPGTVGLALGYGRTSSGPVANGVGVNVNDCLTDEVVFASKLLNPRALLESLDTNAQSICVFFVAELSIFIFIMLF